MAKINVLVSTWAVAMAISLAAAAAGETWPPRCAGYNKAMGPCDGFVAGKVAGVPADCCNELHLYIDDATKSTEKAREACYCVTESAEKTEYSKERIDAVARTCGFQLPPPYMDCRTIKV